MVEEFSKKQTEVLKKLVEEISEKDGFGSSFYQADFELNHRRVVEARYMIAGCAAAFVFLGNQEPQSVVAIASTWIMAVAFASSCFLYVFAFIREQRFRLLKMMTDAGGDVVSKLVRFQSDANDEHLIIIGSFIVSVIAFSLSLVLFVMSNA